MALAGRSIFTDAPQAADYEHSTDTGHTVTVTVCGRVYTLREVRLTADEYLAQYQAARYGSFFGLTLTQEQVSAYQSEQL